MKNSYSSNIAELLYRSSIAAATVTALFALTLGGIQTANAQGPVRKGIAEERKDMREAGTSTRRDIIRTTQGIIKDVREDNMKMRASSTLAFREDRASTTAAIKAKRTDLLKQLAALKGEKKQELSAEKKQRVGQIMNEVYMGLGKQIERLTKVDAVLAARITQTTAAGADTTKAATLMTAAQTALSKARVDYEATAALSKEQTASSTSATVLKDLAKTAETSIKSAAKAYKNVADEMKPYLTTPAGIRASSTTSVSASTTSNN